MLSDASARQAETQSSSQDIVVQFPLIMGGYAVGEDVVKASLVTQTSLEDLLLREREGLATYDSALARLTARLGDAPQPPPHPR